MLKPNCPPGELTYQQGYQQALEDFAIAPYLNALRHGSTDLLPSFSFRRFLFPSLDLPANFPQVKPPRFGDGDKLQWTIDRQDNLKSADWGIAIGRFYSFAPHH